jgi:hypothetical protein
MVGAATKNLADFILNVSILTCEKQVPTSQLVRLVVADNDPSNLTCAELNILVCPPPPPSSSAVGTTMVVEKSQSARNMQWKSFLMW